MGLDYDLIIFVNPDNAYHLKKWIMEHDFYLYAHTSANKRAWT